MCEPQSHFACFSSLLPPRALGIQKHTTCTLQERNSIMAIISTLFESAIQHSTRSNGMKLLLALVVLVVYKYRSHAIGTRPRRDLKQPKGAVPFLGHMPLLASIPGTRLYHFFEKQYNELGPVWSISLPFIGRMIQIDSPEVLEHCVKTNFWSYEKGPILQGALYDLTGNGIFASDGEHWRFQRKLASQIFTVKAFRQYTSDSFMSEGRKVLDFLGQAADAGTIIDFHLLMHNYTLDTFGLISFGQSYDCLKNGGKEVPFAASFDSLGRVCSTRFLNPVWKLYERLSGVGKKVQYDRALVRRHAENIIAKRRKEGYHSSRKDLLQWLLETPAEDGKPLSDELVMDNIINFTIAGRDTTAETIAWLFYILHRDSADKDVLNTLRQEVDSFFAGSDQSYDAFKQQKYSEAWYDQLLFIHYELFLVISALRIYPSVPRNLKLCVADDTLPGGTKIYKGEWITWSSYVMGRSEKIWGPDAKEFKPSRWINSEKPSPAKYNVFHLGPRVCLGQQFATVQVQVILGMMLQSFEFELVEPSKEPTYGASVTLSMDGGLPMRVKRRGGASAI
ncbi:hypothetical protein KVV02_005827 [Mortierella alpina]|uniref:Cytochrome P450 n=1 Tax=Mortierella alpina TaxID=64518 RepID=A0A9P8A1R5_MORAP|nr:hypothetical protein KVV02_005827 [Mortierella alpina]